MKLRKLLIDYIPMALAGILIIFFSIVKEQTFLKTLPTIVTLFVQILLARANRYSFLLGGTNSVIYGISYLTEGLYFSATSALIMSAPMQIYSFFNWGKNQTGSHRTELRVLGAKKRGIVFLLILLGWALCYFGLSQFFADAAYPSFDTLGFVLGITVTFLSAFRYVESQYISAFSCALHIVMWILICLSNPSNINYLIISVYNLFMVVKAAVNWTRQYVHDKKEKETTKNEIQAAS